MTQAVIYTRVSSREQEQEGFSLGAQSKLLKDYAERNGFHIVAAFEDVETAKATGRKQFAKLVDFFKRNSSCRVLLVEKTDRVSRNFRDAVTLEDLDIEVHFVKEGQIISKDSKSQATLIYGFNLVMARHYSNNLREEVKKGMHEKASQGIFPGHAPFGYRNNKAERTIEVDPVDSNTVKRIFELYATGAHTLSTLRKKIRIETGKTISRANVSLILKNQFYIGYFQWVGQTYPGTHPVFVSPRLFDQVQAVLAGHNRPKYSKREIAFRGLMNLGRPAKSMMLVGLRGVGKTVLLDQMRRDAEAGGLHTVRIEAPENRSLPALLAPALRLALLHLSKKEAAKDYAVRGLKALAGFASKLKLTYHDIEVGLDYDPEPGLADNGDLEGDLGTLLVQVGAAAKAAGTAVVLFIDELQYVEEPQTAALIAALHRCAQEQLPVTIVGAGLPQLRARMGEAKSYAERLFDFPEIGPLSPPDARDAIVRPAENEGAQIEERAIDLIIEKTQGYPYFLQEWGKHTWDIAPVSPIRREDVLDASDEAVAALDESFFRVRFDRLTPTEKKYLRAMADLGPGPHRSGDIADELGRSVSSLGPTRAGLIAKGMIWSPTHGDTAFTVPLFDEFMKRIMPGDEWKRIGS